MTAVAAVSLAMYPAEAGEPCEPHWDNAIAQPGLNGFVFAMTEFDDGTGAALYVGGSFTTAGGQAVNRIARWDGSSWSPLGDGMGGAVSALMVFDDGTGGGPALYAAGGFTTAGGQPANRIAKWDGAAGSWSALGSGIDDLVLALAVFDDGLGGGPALYAGGEFLTAGGETVNGVAKWNGASWLALGSGMSGDSTFRLVTSLAVFDDGSGGGEALYAGGHFTTAGPQTVNYVAKWDGESWSPLDNGLGGFVTSLTVFDDGFGGGEHLYVGGWFTTTGTGQIVNRIAKWNAPGGVGGWSPVGGMSAVVRRMTVFDDGTGGGEALYAAGDFTLAGGVPVNRIAKWNGPVVAGGLGWSPLGSGLVNNPPNVNYAFALQGFNDGTGPALYVGGGFNIAGGEPSNWIAAWHGCLSEPECALADLNCDGAVNALDIVVLVQSFGPCPPPAPGPGNADCPADLNGDGVVNTKDLQILLALATPGNPGGNGPPGKGGGNPGGG